ncbi:MAG TPA: DUF599 domain-containing protein [Geminicoccaceae bacterium]|nr:DUF599 domain-containing protein [Geminicoccaceae bacterium]
MLDDIGWPDIAAPLFFILVWCGYVAFADLPRRGRNTLMARMHQYRQAWMRRMLVRDNRIVDTQIVSLLVQNISFFASSTILIVGGLAAVMGAREQAMSVLAEIPLIAPTSPVLWDMKILLLILVFVYAFFKFTWSLRQFNYVAILIGSAPILDRVQEPGPEALDFADRSARVASRAADHFNRAMRAYYFGLAALSWFIQPYLFILLTAWVAVVVYRREFRSRTVELLGTVDAPIGGEPIVRPVPADPATVTPRR